MEGSKTPKVQVAGELTPRPKAYSYIRMSTKEQLEGDSVRRQVDKTRQYAADNELELIEKYDDHGVSAFRGLNAEQGALRRFLDAVKNGDIPKGSHLVIESMDRLTRQTALVAVGLLTEIIDGGIVVVTLDDGMRYSTETFATNQYQLFIAVGAMMRSHDESRRKSGMLSDVWGQKRRQLRNEGKVMTSRVPAWLRVNKAKSAVEIIPERVKIVNEIFELACSGYGTYSIARLLEGRGEVAWGSPKQTVVRSKVDSARTEPVWHESYIEKILANRAVLGEFQPHKTERTPDGKKARVADGEAIVGYYPQIVSHSIFRDAALATERRKVGAKGRKGAVYANIFSGLLHCDRCGSGMRYIDKGAPPKGGKYLRCSRTVTGGRCVPKVYRYEVIEEAILAALESLDVERVLGATSLSTRLAERKHEREMMRIDLESIERKIESINAALTSGGGPEPVSTLRLLRGLEHDHGEKSSQIKLLDDQIAEMLSIDPARRKAVLAGLLARIRDETDKEKKVKTRRALAGELQRMIEAIVILPDTHFAHEIMDADESWQKRYRVDTHTRLERYLDDYGFEMKIKFRSGVDQFINGVKGIVWKAKWSSKFNDLKFLSKYTS